MFIAFCFYNIVKKKRKKERENNNLSVENLRNG